MSHRSQVLVSAFVLATGSLGLTAAADRSSDSPVRKSAAQFVQSDVSQPSDRARRVLDAHQRFQQKSVHLRELKQQALEKRDIAKARRLTIQIQTLQKNYREYRLTMQQQMTPREVMQVREAMQEMREMRLRKLDAERSRSQTQPVKVGEQHLQQLREMKTQEPATPRSPVDVQPGHQRFEAALQQKESQQRERRPLTPPSMNVTVERQTESVAQRRAHQRKR